MAEEVRYYNHEQKERFLAEREVSYQKIRLVMRTFFNTTREYEEALDKDCSNFTSSEILNMYSSCTTSSWEQLLNFNSQLKIYTAWCIRGGYVFDNQNHYEELDKNDMKDCLNWGLKDRMVITRDDLEKEIRSWPNISDQFLALAIFEGLGGKGYKDFYNLLPSQFEDNKVKLEDRTLEVSTTLVERAKESAEEYQKYSMEGPLRNGYRMTDPSVIKDSANAFTDTELRNVRKIHRRLVHLEKTYGKAFGYTGLRNSGRIDMIKRLMAKDGTNDLRAIYDKYKDDIELRYGKLQRIYRWADEYSKFFE